MQIDCMRHPIDHCIDVDITTTFGFDSQSSDACDWSVLNRFISLEYIMPIYDVRRCSAVSQPDIIQNSFIYSVEVGDIMVIKIKVLLVLRGIKSDPAWCDITNFLNGYPQVL